GTAAAGAGGARRADRRRVARARVEGERFLKSLAEALVAPVPASAQARTSVLFIIHGLGRAGPELRLLDFAQRFPGSTGVHVVSLWEELRWYQRALMRRAMERMDVIVCNGQALKDVIIGTRAVAPRVTVIPNGVDCEHFRSTPALRLAERERQGYGPGHFVL